MYRKVAALAPKRKCSIDLKIAAEFEKKARNLRVLVEQKLWNREAVFFKSRLDTGKLADVREIIGYTPDISICRRKTEAMSGPGSS